MAKSKCIAYFLWMIGGIFGLHHLYLGRDRQAFVWWCTQGGSWVGVLRDLWRIPEYVDSANEEPNYMRKLVNMMQTSTKPPFSTARFCAQLGFGIFLGYLVLLAIPKEFLEELPILGVVVVPLAVAVGVHTVGNIGREEGPLKPALYGSYGLCLFFAVPNGIAYQAVASTVVFRGKARFRQTREPWRDQSICRRLLVLGIAGAFITGLWCSCIYFNGSITTSTGETIKVRDAVNHFFNSPIWKEFVSTMRTLYQRAWAKGWRRVWADLMDSLDPLGEANAYQVLGLDQSASDSEIKQRYRQLARQYHPDKNKDLDKAEAERQFIAVQEAYEILSKLRQKRSPQKTMQPGHQ